MEKMIFNKRNISLYNGDAQLFYNKWKTPTMILSDGPYGISGYKGDLDNEFRLAEWYAPHIKAWSEYSMPRTTLWFWCTEQGWASVHSEIVKNGWDFKACNVWDKGMSHVAGNTNTKTISHLPIVTEVCVQYVKRSYFIIGESKMTMQEWLRYEWERTGLPFSKTNDACGVADAATRKYFTKSNLWYMPPADAFSKISQYANEYGSPDGRPYFSLNGKEMISKEEWEYLKPVFHCPFGTTNVWSISQLRSKERLKDGTKALHNNQKPLSLIKNLVEMSTDKNDVVWDPFGGLCTTAVACAQLGRACYCAEINDETCNKAAKRLQDALLEQVIEF